MRISRHILPFICAAVTLIGCRSHGQMGSQTKDAALEFEDLPVFEVKFDQIVSKFASAGSLKDLVAEGWAGMYKYQADFRLYKKTFAFDRKQGDAASLYDGEFIELTNDGFDQATKKLEVGGIDGTQPYWGTSYLNFTFHATEYERQGVSRGQYGAAIRLLKDKQDGRTRVIANLDDYESGTITPVDSLRIVNNSLEVVYRKTRFGMTGRIPHKLVIKFNETFDTELFLKVDNEFSRVAYYHKGLKVQPGDKI